MATISRTVSMRADFDHALLCDDRNARSYQGMNRFMNCMGRLML